MVNQGANVKYVKHETGRYVSGKIGDIETVNLKNLKGRVVKIISPELRKRIYKYLRFYK